MSKAKGVDKAAKGWRDIDVLAFGKEEVLVIQTKSMANFKANWTESKPEITSFFKEASDFVESQYDVRGKNLRQVFIAEVGLTKGHIDELEENGIEFRTLEDVAQEFLDLLNKRNVKGKKRGVIDAKEENNVTRILVLLVDKFNITPK